MLAARLSEDPDRNVLLLEAGPDYSSIEQTPADLTNSLVSSGPHDWGLIARATPGGKSLIRAAGSPAAARQSTAKSRCTAHRRTSRNGRRGAIASGASSKSCHRRLEDDRDARGDVHGAGGPIWIERPRSEASQPLNSPFSRPRARQGTRKSGTTTIPIQPASAHRRATGATASASQPRLAILHPRVIA